MAHGTRVAELRDLLQRRQIAERLAVEHELATSAAEKAAELVMVGVPEPAAVGEVLFVLEHAGEAALPGRIAWIIGARKAAKT